MTENEPKTVSRRRVTAGIAWTVPVVAMVAQAPYAVASPVPCDPAKAWRDGLSRYPELSYDATYDAIVYTTEASQTPDGGKATVVISHEKANGSGAGGTGAIEYEPGTPVSIKTYLSPQPDPDDGPAEPVTQSRLGDLATITTINGSVKRTIFLDKESCTITESTPACNSAQMWEAVLSSVFPRTDNTLTLDTGKNEWVFTPGDPDNVPDPYNSIPVYTISIISADESIVEKREIPLEDKTPIRIPNKPGITLDTLEKVMVEIWFGVSSNQTTMAYILTRSSCVMSEAKSDGSS